jgi:hypothetical protein
VDLEEDPEVDLEEVLAEAPEVPLEVRLVADLEVVVVPMGLVHITEHLALLAVVVVQQLDWAEPEAEVPEAEVPEAAGAPLAVSLTAVSSAQKTLVCWQPHLEMIHPLVVALLHLAIFAASLLFQFVAVLEVASPEVAVDNMAVDYTHTAIDSRIHKDAHKLAVGAVVANIAVHNTALAAGIAHLTVVVVPSYQVVGLVVESNFVPLAHSLAV